MNKLRTLLMLQEHLDKEFAWRLKEIADLRILVAQARSSRQRTVIRAGVALLYAHWEGFIKNSSVGYLNFVGCQHLSYGQLESCFVVFGVKRTLAGLTGSRRTETNIAAVDFFVNHMDDNAHLHLKHAVDTESNLKSHVFENIALSIGIDPSRYQPRYKLLDESLLRRRNKIAHGEYVDLDSAEYGRLADEILQMMRWYKTDVENAAAMGAYERVAD